MTNERVENMGRETKDEKKTANEVMAVVADKAAQTGKKGLKLLQ